ncbi:unnamed protein product [Phaeothamnion confervicola]
MNASSTIASGDGGRDGGGGGASSSGGGGGCGFAGGDDNSEGGEADHGGGGGDDGDDGDDGGEVGPEESEEALHARIRQKVAAEYEAELGWYQRRLHDLTNGAESGAEDKLVGLWDQVGMVQSQASKVNTLETELSLLREQLVEARELAELAEREVAERDRTIEEMQAYSSQRESSIVDFKRRTEAEQADFSRRHNTEVALLRNALKTMQAEKASRRMSIRPSCCLLKIPANGGDSSTSPPAASVPTAPSRKPNRKTKLRKQNTELERNRTKTRDILIKQDLYMQQKRLRDEAAQRAANETAKLVFAAIMRNGYSVGGGPAAAAADGGGSGGGTELHAEVERLQHEAEQREEHIAALSAMYREALQWGLNSFPKALIAPGMFGDAPTALMASLPPPAPLRTASGGSAGGAGGGAAGGGGGAAAAPAAATAAAAGAGGGSRVLSYHNNTDNLASLMASNGHLVSLMAAHGIGANGAPIGRVTNGAAAGGGWDAANGAALPGSGMFDRKAWQAAMMQASGNGVAAVGVPAEKRPARAPSPPNYGNSPWVSAKGMAPVAAMAAAAVTAAAPLAAQSLPPPTGTAPVPAVAAAALPCAATANVGPAGLFPVGLPPKVHVPGRDDDGVAVVDNFPGP